MQTSKLAALLFAGALGMCAAPAIAADAAQTGSPAGKNANKNLTLVGCVQSADTGSDQFTLADEKNGTDTIYRLTGTSMEQYLGRRVQIVGGVVTPRLKISGGLLPSPNVAAQAGAMDPSRAAIAGSSGGPATGTGNPTLPEFRVKTVHSVPGDCKAPK